MRRKDTRTDALLCAPMGLLSGLEAQSAISELLEEIYGDGLARRRKIPGSRPHGPGPMCQARKVA